MARSQSTGTLRNAGAAASGNTMFRTASTGTLGGKNFGAGQQDGMSQLEVQLTTELERLLRNQRELEDRLKSKVKLTWEKKQLPNKMFKKNTDGAPVVRDNRGRPAKTTHGALAMKTGSQGAAELGSLEENLKKTEEELRHDENGLRDLETHMAHIIKERNHLEYLNRLSRDFVESMASEENLGGIINKYGAVERNLQREYHEARAKHAKGIKMLEREFDYHPAYKRGFTRGERKENQYKGLPGEIEAILGPRPGCRGRPAEEFSAAYYTPLADPMKSKSSKGGR